MQIDESLKRRVTQEDFGIINRKSVVLVDDNKELRDLNAQLLGSDFNVYPFGSEEELVGFLRYGGRARAYVLDGEVPRKRGETPELLVEEMVSRIREAHRGELSLEYVKPGILVMSGQGLEGLAKKLGVGVVPKGNANVSKAVADYFASQREK